MSSRVGVNLRVSAYLSQGDRKYMEDVFEVAYQKSHDKKEIEYAFFGIFDGHGGKEAANFAKDNLMDCIVGHKLFWSDNNDDVCTAIKEGFLQTHLLMMKEVHNWPKTASGWTSTSGTTCSIAFIRRQYIFIGHVGDSGIVLGYEGVDGDWQGYPLTTDHKPDNVLEKKRIVQSGGKVVNKSGVPRVVWSRPRTGHQGPVRRSTSIDEIPFLAVARSLGDLWSYNPNNDQFIVSPEPDVCCIPIDISKHRCLIFGTDGLWNVLGPNAAVSVASYIEKNNEKYYIGIPSSNGKPRVWLNPSRSVVTWALECYDNAGVRADNTSAVTVYLDPPGKSKREVLYLSKTANNTATAFTPEDSSNEPSVRLNVYNQSQKPYNNNGAHGSLNIKERIPEECVQKNNDSSSCSSSSSDDSTYKTTDHRECSKDDTLVSSNCQKCGKTLEVTESRESTSSNTNSTDHTSTSVASNETKSKSSKYLVSSSSSGETDNKDMTSGPKVKLMPNNTYFVNVNVKCSNTVENRRKTRSGMFHKKEQKPLVSNNNNTWKNNTKDSKASTSKLPNQSNVNNTSSSDPINRVLKSVNRSHSLGGSAASMPTKLLCNKRKRLSDPATDGTSSLKSPRVGTRSHTWTHKPMITRSQEKTHKVVRLK